MSFLDNTIQTVRSLYESGGRLPHGSLLLCTNDNFSHLSLSESHLAKRYCEPAEFLEDLQTIFDPRNPYHDGTCILSPDGLATFSVAAIYRLRESMQLIKQAPQEGGALRMFMKLATQYIADCPAGMIFGSGVNYYYLGHSQVIHKFSEHRELKSGGYGIVFSDFTPGAVDIFPMQRYEEVFEPRQNLAKTMQAISYTNRHDGFYFYNEENILKGPCFVLPEHNLEAMRYKGLRRLTAHHLSLRYGPTFIRRETSLPMVFRQGAGREYRDVSSFELELNSDIFHEPEHYPEEIQPLRP